MADALTQTVGGVYFLKNGTYRDPFNLSSFSPASNVNRIEVYLEDGVSTNVVMINYKADNKGYPSSVFFPMIFDSTNQHTVAGEAGPRTFAKYWALVPPQVLQWNANGNAPMSIAGTVVQIAGSGLIGAYQNYSSLVLANPATEALYLDGEVAYIWELEGENNYGFYMVAFDSGTSTYSWERIETPVNQIENVDSRQYNIVGMQIQKGNLPRPTSVVSITEQYIRYIMTYIAQANGIAVENRDFITILNTFMSDMIAGTQPLDGLTLEYEVDNRAKFIYDGKDVIVQYRNINGELFKNILGEAEPDTGVTFEEGMVIQYTGTTGASGKKLAKEAVASEINTDPRLLLGLVTQVTPEGHAIYNIFGVVNNLDTSSYTLGQTIYFDSVNGGMTQTPPIAPNVQVVIGMVRTVHATQGRIEVFLDYGEKLSELHDVWFNGHTFVGGETILFNIVENRWELFDLTGKLLEVTDRLDDLETFKNVTVPNTYETKTDATTHKARTTALETFRDVTVPATYETKTIVSGINSRVTSLELSKLNKDFTSLIEEISLSLSDLFVVDKGSGARKVSLGTLASYLSTQELQLFTIVEELPMENQNHNTIYLLVTENEEGQNQLLEYIWITNQERWELIGSLEVDLSDYYTKAEVNGLLEDKVDKEAGKGLSTNDYTNTDKQSVEKIPTIEQDILDLESDKVDKNNAITGATKTKITYDAKGLVTGGADLEVIDIPELPQTKITDLGTDLGNKVTKNADIVGATKPKITYDSKGLVTAGADLVDTDIPTLEISKITGLQTSLNDKVDKVAGKGLSTEDYTTTEKNKLAGLTVEIPIELWDMPIKTLALSDVNKLFRCSWSSDQILTIPTNATVPFPIGTMVTFLLVGTSTVLFAGESGVTLTSMDSLVELKTQYGMASLIKTDTDTWQLVGALE